MWAESRSNQPLLSRSSRKKAEVIDQDSNPALFRDFVFEHYTP